MLWIILYGLLLTIGSQVLAFYLYKDLNDSVNSFIQKGIKNERIISITENRYTPGKGDYKVLNLSSNNSLPLFIDNQEIYEDSIKVNQILFKDPNSKYFKIVDDSIVYEYKIRTLLSQQRFMKIYLFSIAFIVAIGGLFMYNIKIKK